MTFSPPLWEEIKTRAENLEGSVYPFDEGKELFIVLCVELSQLRARVDALEAKLAKEETK